MRPVTYSVRRTVRAFWWWLRQVTGDAAYENYLRSAVVVAGSGRTTETPATRCPGGIAPTLTAEEFYVDTLRRKYARVSRCC